MALGLPQLKILWQPELEGHIEVTVIYRRDKVSCPRCGKVTHKEHDRRRQNKQDRRLRDKVLKQLDVEGAIVGKALYTGDINLKQALAAVG